MVVVGIFALTATPALAKPQWAIVIHGGAGVIERKDLTPETEAAYRAAMARAVATGTAVLDKGGTAMDAVEAVIVEFEDDPLFNAGRGAVFTAEGGNSLDAAVMDGATLNAGAVAGVARTRHPVRLARAVMEKSRHVMMAGSGTDAFAASVGLEQVEPSFFFTERRWSQLVKALTDMGLPIPPRPAGAPAPQAFTPIPDDRKFGTVGVVALDTAGNVAAGTSTGGATAKRWGRVGDSPIIGAGTYASNQSCAVSATGTGEYFIRLTVAREICALVQYRGLTLQQAADTVIQDRLTALGGDGGVIAIAPDGQIAWSYNTSGMYRARAAQGQAPVIAIYKDEP
ncbi:MAG: isoaspartyl peptidase/L-asparaginase [Caulobacter sp.]|nr:isoaspartyl peptidase/L-asparaginase [Caulobacter sp.]